MPRSDVLAMIKRRAEGADPALFYLLPHISCDRIHYIYAKRVTLEHTQQTAAPESPRTTKLYDRTQDEISLDEVERTRI
jgi:hypothetical protein